MIRTELILDTRVKSKKGYPVKIRVYDDIKKVHKYVSLKIYQDSNELKQDTFLRKRFSDLDNEIKFCNDNLYNIEESLNIIKNGIPLDDIDLEIQILKKRLELLIKKKGLKNSIGFVEFANKLIEERKVLKRPTTTYNNAKKAVAKFIEPEADMLINSITREWVKDFDLFYINRNLKDSSIKTHIGIIKAIYTEAQSRESLNIKKDNPFVKLRAFKNDKKTTSLTIDDLKKIKNININDLKATKSILSTSEIKQIADLFLFQFSIGGQDLIDIANLKWENIKKDRVVFKRFKNRYKKTEGEEIDNKLNDFCLSVIEKYGDKTNKRIFTLIPDPTIDRIKYQSFIVTLNQTVFKIISKHIKTENTFTSKSTRYLFRTLAGNLLIDSYIIMKLQGHTPQGVTFGYQGAINYEVQDKEHQKILDLVFKE